MARWIFEPGHTAVEFCVRHMMVTYVRGHFKDVHGELEFDPAQPEASWVKAVIDARQIWSGEPERDSHLRSSDFLDVEVTPNITYHGTGVRIEGGNDYLVEGELTVRRVTRRVPLRVRYLGQWQTPWWEDGVDKGPKTRAGFVAEAIIDRREFGVSWNAALELGGVVVGHEVRITIDAEAILQS